MNELRQALLPRQAGVTPVAATERSSLHPRPASPR